MTLYSLIYFGIDVLGSSSTCVCFIHTHTEKQKLLVCIKVHYASQLRVTMVCTYVCVCVCVCVCPAHLWGRSGCSRTLEWHTAPSSEALSCHQQNDQSEPATYCEKRISAICVTTYVRTFKIHNHHTPCYIRTCVKYTHTHTHSMHTCTC